MITGGCCHDYKQQKNIISEGISMFPQSGISFSKMDRPVGRTVTITSFTIIALPMRKMPNLSSPLPIFTKQVNPPLLCIVRCIPIWSIPAKEGEKKAWTEMLGASSKGHGPKAAITVNKVKKYANHPIMKDMPDGWMTPEGELYNVQQVYEGTTVLAYGDNGKNKAPKEPQACAWINTHGKGRIFSTTLGHHNSTMSTMEYLDMLGNAVHWITGK